MKRSLPFALALLIACAATAYGQLLVRGVGPGGNGTTLAACGSGVINLSAGCTLPIMLGLLP